MASVYINGWLSKPLILKSFCNELSLSGHLSLGFYSNRLLPQRQVANMHDVSNENSDSESCQVDFCAQGYQYKPEYTKEELENIDHQSQRAPSEHERSSDLSWCCCGE